MRYNSRYTSIRQWIALPFLFGFIIYGLLKLIFLFFDFTLSTKYELAINLGILVSLSLLFYFLSRDIKYVDLAKDGITVKYYSQIKKKDELIPLSQIVAIEIYVYKALNAANEYQIIKEDGEKVYVDSHFLPLPDLENYCQTNNIHTQTISNHN